MSEYNFDKKLKLPSADFASPRHILFLEIGSKTAASYRFLDPKNPIEFDWVEDDKIRIYSNRSYEETQAVLELLKKISKEIFTTGRSPTYDSHPAEIQKLRENADRGSLEPKSSSAPAFVEAATNTNVIPIKSSKPHEIVFESNLDKLSGKQAYSYEQLEIFLDTMTIRIRRVDKDPKRILLVSGNKIQLEAVQTAQLVAHQIDTLNEKINRQTISNIYSDFVADNQLPKAQFEKLAIGQP